MIPLGKTLTLREETIDVRAFCLVGGGIIYFILFTFGIQQQADEDASEAGMHQEDGSLDAENDDTVPGNTTGEQDGDEQDLDADLEDMENQPEFEDDEEEEEEEEDGDGNAELSLDEPDAMSE